MAKIKSIPGLTVSIQTDNTDLPEFISKQPQPPPKIPTQASVQNPNPKSPGHGLSPKPPKSLECARYICCPSDVPFQVELTVTHEYDFGSATSITIWVSVDGHKVGAHVFLKSLLTNNERITRYIDGAYSRVTPKVAALRPLWFRRLEVDDDMERLGKDKASLSKGLGDIVVSVHRTQYKAAKATAESGSMFKKEPIKRITRALVDGTNAVSHSVFYGRKKFITHTITPKITYLDGQHNPWATFVFKYRGNMALDYPTLEKVPKEKGTKLSNKVESTQGFNAAKEAQHQQEKEEFKAAKRRLGKKAAKATVSRKRKSEEEPEDNMARRKRISMSPGRHLNKIEDGVEVEEAKAEIEGPEPEPEPEATSRYPQRRRKTSTL